MQFTSSPHDHQARADLQPDRGAVVSPGHPLQRLQCRERRAGIHEAARHSRGDRQNSQGPCGSTLAEANGLLIRTLMVIGHITHYPCGYSPRTTPTQARTNTPGVRRTGACGERRPGGVACAHMRPPLSSSRRGPIVGDSAYRGNRSFSMLPYYARSRKALNV